MSASGVPDNSAGPNRGPAITTKPPPNWLTNSRTISQNRSLIAVRGMSSRKITSLAKKSLRLGVSVGRNKSFDSRTCGSDEARKVRKPSMPISLSR